MPRSGPVPDELDFDIHVDPSCLSEPMADTDVAAIIKVEAAEVGDEEKNETNEADAVEEVKEDDAAKTGAGDDEPGVKEEEEKPSTDATGDDDKAVLAEKSSDADDTVQDELDESDAKSGKDLSDEGPGELAATDEAGLEEPEREFELEPEQETRKEEAPETESDHNQSEPDPGEETEEKVPPQPSEPESQDDIASGELADQVAEQVEQTLRMAQSQSQDAPASTPVNDEPEEDEEDEEDEEEEEDKVHDESDEVREASRSSSSLRRASGRTEALIQAAAKEVLERLEAQTMETIRNRSRSPRVSMDSTRDGTEIHYDTRSKSTRRDSYDAGSETTRRESYDTRSSARASRRESDAFPASTHTEDGGDSSSQHGADSDIFSDRSPRSSIGSFDGDADYHKETKDRSSKRSSRMSDMSMSDISHYDREEFIPTIRATQRMPFRTPSDVRALQYSSPAASVIGSPHSSKRPHLPTISRLGSPTASAQYSHKGRTTPTRFKPKKEPAPLVLLHVTLLPLRWQWAEVLEAASSDTLSPDAKTLREAWHHLHDRVAETVCERGILLSHPQEDYEILEERLLEALDLPLRRRARVLECGHYIGPSNEMALNEDTDSDEEYDEDSRRRSALAKTHWCNTCRHDIRCESLGPGKIFRIKVYASNGLMRTGAWAACWKEMERVDVEIEPVVESGVLNELERLAIAQSQKMEPQQMELVRHDPTILESTEGRDVSDDRELSAMSRGMHSLDREAPAFEETTMDSSRLEEAGMIEPKYIEHESHVPSSTILPAIEETCLPLSPKPKSRRDKREERRLRDEARLREIYGHSPPPHEPDYEPAPEPEPHSESYMAQSPPPPPVQQPQEQPQRQQQQQQQQHYHEPQHQQPTPQPQPDDAAAFARHQERQRAFQNAGLGELLLEAARVFMQDKKNLAMVVMGLLVLFLAVKPAQREVRDWDGKFVEQIVPEMPEAPVPAPPVMETVEAIVVESLASPETLEIEVAVLPSQETQVPEPSQQVSASTPATTVAAEPAESSSTTPTATEQTSFVETEAASPSKNNKFAETPSPSAVHETITTREVVRIVETATETVKVVVTETEVVRVQATAPSVAPGVLPVDVPVVDEKAASPPEVVAEVQEEAAETEQPPVEEPVAGVVERDGAEMAAAEEAGAETGTRDEL